MTEEGDVAGTNVPAPSPISTDSGFEPHRMKVGKFPSVLSYRRQVNQFGGGVLEGRDKLAGGGAQRNRRIWASSPVRSGWSARTVRVVQRNNLGDI